MSFLFLFGAFILSLLAFYIAYKTKPASNQAGTTITLPAVAWQTPKKSFCIGTYNVQSGKDIHGKRDLTRAANVIQHCDVVGIQEVYAKGWLEKVSQTQQLAESNQLGWLFAATRRRWFREHRGNALLSRIAVNSWTVKMLPDSTGKQYRNLVTAMIDFNGIKIAILVTHLHTKKGRQRQLTKVIDEFQRYQHAILLGDLNTRPDNALIRTLLQQANVNDALKKSFPEHVHSERIDWIITKNLKASAADYQEVGISDHPFYSVNISFE